MRRELELFLPVSPKAPPSVTKKDRNSKQYGQRVLPEVELELASPPELEGEVDESRLVVVEVSPEDDGELEPLSSISSLVLPGDSD